MPDLNDFDQMGNAVSNFSITELVRGDVPKWLAPSILHTLWDSALNFGAIVEFPRLGRVQYIWHTRPNGIGFRLADLRDMEDGGILCTINAIGDPKRTVVIPEISACRLANGAYVAMSTDVSNAHLCSELIWADQQARNDGFFDGKTRKPMPVKARTEKVTDPLSDELLSYPLVRGILPRYRAEDFSDWA